MRKNISDALLLGDYEVRTEDACIVQECLNGESEAFGILVDKYKAGIYAYVYAKLGNFQDSEDIVQEVFLEAYRGLRNLRRWESFAFWLYRIARNLCGNSIRASSKRPDRDFIEDQDAKVLGIFSINSYRESRMDDSLREGLSLLSEGYREVLMLHYFGGMNSVDIARSLGTSPTAVRKRLSRARAQLREEMTAMMDTAFEGQRLPATFTFRIVEAVKRIKINPVPRMAGVPWGLSMAMGIIVTVLSLNPQMSTTSDIVIPAGSPLFVEAKALETGEIPVDILKTSNISAIASKLKNGDEGDPQNAVMLVPQQAEGGKWTEKSEMPMARMGTCSAVVDGRIYVIGGAKNNRESFLAVEEYDPATDTWEKKDDMPDGRLMCSASAVNGKIYVIGGWRSLEVGDPVPTVEEYDPATDTWEEKADMPTARGVLSTSVVDGKIYAIGGLSFALGGFDVSVVEEYDPATDTWEKKTDMPTARQGVSTGVVDGKIYAIGGGEGSAVEEYDPKTDTWTKKTPMPIPRSNLSICRVDGKLYAIGGQNQAGVLSTVEVYDPAKDIWMIETIMPTARAFLSACAVNGKVYSIGGTTETFLEPKVDWPILDTVEEYDTEVAPPTQGKAVEAEGKLMTLWGEIKSD
ncbi:sigma-70 family RNA polymerase sigma factor [Candidatus Poribacteria bacterium]